MPGQRPAFRWLLYVAATIVIAMALAVGLVRLLLPLVPQYQDDIRGWASAATGYDIRFEGISASWPLAGPRLHFRDVVLSRPGDAQPVLAARELSAGVSLLRTLTEARASLAWLSVEGARLRVERTADGAWLAQGRPLADLLPKPGEHPPRLELELGDIGIELLDARRSPASVAIALERLHASIGTERLLADGRLGLPEVFGRQLDIEIQAPMPLPRPLALPPAWRTRVSGRGLDLAKLATWIAFDARPLRAARGDAVLEIAFDASRPQHLALQLDLDDVDIGAARYEALAGRFGWDRTPEGWSAALDGLRLRREGRDSPGASAALRHEAAGEATAERWTAQAKFLRLEDLFPFVQAVLAGTEMEQRLPRALHGDVRDVQAEFAAQAEEPARFALRLGFERLGFEAALGELAADGLSGTLVADGGGGRLQLASRDVSVRLTQWFRDSLPAKTLDGLLVWRSGPQGVRLLGEDIRLTTEASSIRSRLELQFPADAGSPRIDAEATASSGEARDVLRYLPLKRFPPGVVDWLERGIIAGRVPEARFEMRGPLREFPFDQGEGVFRVALGLENGTLDYAEGWPRVEDLTAQVVFDGVSMYSTSNQARIGPLPVRDYSIRIPDLRHGVLAVSGAQRADVAQVLDFVRATPLARTIGPVLGRVSGSGPVDAAVRLALPVTHVADHDLNVLFDARGCRVAFTRLPLDLKDVRGRIRLHNERFTAQGVRGVMLGEPVNIAISAAETPDAPVSHTAVLTGSTPVPRLTSAFDVPLREYLSGRASWNATVRIPSRRPAAPPLGITVRSDLREVESALPLPLTKPAGVAWPATLELAFPEGDFIDLAGHLEPPFSWNVRLASVGGRWRVERGALRAGPGEARLPRRNGLEVSGHVAQLRLADWLDLGGMGDGRPLQELYRDFNLQLDSIAVAGQVFRDVDAKVTRGAESWLVAVTGPQAEGAITVPYDTAKRPLGLDMKRLWLLETEPERANERTDPRDMMEVKLEADDAAIGQWHLGRLEMGIQRTPLGVKAGSIRAQSASFRIEGSGSWEVGATDSARQSTQLAARLTATDVRDTLERLGFDPVIEGEEAHVSANLRWPGGPDADFMQRASGRIALEMKDGQVLDLEPGGSGRLLGLLSVTALPRRLSLDFSDVFRQGLAFDAIKGDFRVGSGSAYTCNLGLSGPAADIAMVGRTGFEGRDYEQVAVVRPQVSNMLAVGGAVIGGPVGGVTALLISQIFRKPLGTLGESYYRVSGPWENPDVLRIERGEVDAAEFRDCEKEVTAALESGALVLPREATPAAPAAPSPGARAEPAP